MVALDHGGEGRPVASRAKVEEHWHVISATNCHFAPFDFFTLFMPQEHQRLPMGAANGH